VTGQSTVHLALNLKLNLLFPIAQGAIQGTIYGLVGLGLVLLYKSNRIFNFAQGEFGTVAALIGYSFATGATGLPKVPYFVALLLGLVAGTLTGVLTELLVVRPLFHRPRVILLVATAGVALLLVAAETLWFGNQSSQYPPVTEALYGKNAKVAAFSLFGKMSDPASLKVSHQEVFIILGLAVLSAGIALFFRFTATGTAILAVSQEPTAASLVGVSVRRISLVTWALAGFLGAAAGLLFAPIGLIAPGFMTGTILVAAIIAAVLGGITSLPGAFVGGVTIGIVEKIAGSPGLDKFPGSSSVAIAFVLLLILLLRPTGILGKET
jgi:branched-chain amino acid transport system permease protein